MYKDVSTYAIQRIYLLPKKSLLSPIYSKFEICLQLNMLFHLAQGLPVMQNPILSFKIKFCYVSINSGCAHSPWANHGALVNSLPHGKRW